MQATSPVTKFDDVWAMGQFKRIFQRLNDRQKHSVLVWIKANFFDEPAKA